MRIFAVLLLLLSPTLAAQRAVPFLSGRVVDEAGMISPEVRQRVEQKLAAFEQRTGTQVAVLTVESLEGEPIEDFTVRTAQTWKLGQKGKDNGVLFAIAEQDRRMRIEVGYGLEPVLTDAESGRILSNIVQPAFRSGDFGGGIERGVDAILAGLGGEEVPAEPVARTGERAGGRVPAGFALIFLFVIGTFSLIAVTTSGCQSWFLYVMLIPFYFFFSNLLFPSIGIGLVVAWIVLFPILKALFSRGGRGGGGRGLGRRGMGPVIIPWGGGFWGGGGGRGGGGFGGGGFSGGGGSFGGGGASGSW